MQNPMWKHPGTGALLIAACIFLSFMTGGSIAETTGPAPFVRPGDVNGDGSLTIDDALQTLKVLVDSAGEETPQGADMNEDGQIGVAEALFVLQGRVPERSPRLLNDLNDSLSGPEPSAVVELDGGVFYAATSALYGRELFRYDPVTGETRIVKDICSGPLGSGPVNFTIWNGALYFSADDGGSHGRELWKTDGTEKGTTLVSDMNPGATDSTPYALTVLKSEIPRANCLFFMADTDDAGRRIWAMESGDTQPQAVFDIPQLDLMGFDYSIAPYKLVVFRGALYFIPQLLGELHKISIQKKTDPQDPGFVYTKETVTTLPSGAGALTVWPAKDTMIFCANREEIWQTDGTAAGTIRIDHALNCLNPGGFTPLGEEIYFTAVDESNYRKLWRVNSSVNVEKMISTADQDTDQDVYEPEELTIFNGKLFFSAVDFKYGRELWRCDGTKEGTDRISDINIAGDAAPRELTPLGDILYFTATDRALLRGEAGRELWRYDGTTIELAANISPGTNDSDPVFLTAVGGGKLFFAAYDALGTPQKLFYYDTVTGQTTVADDQDGKSGSSCPQQFVSMGDDLYFVAQTAGGEQVWKQEILAPAATSIAALEISAGTPLIVMDEALFFTSRFYDSTSDEYAYKVLFSSDGTAAGIQPVENSPENITEMVVMDGSLYFPGFDDQTGKEIWKSDGATASMVKDIMDFSWGGVPGSSDPAAFIEVGQNTFFMARDASYGIELWRSDGTTDGTVMLTNEDPDLNSVPIGAVNGNLLFTGRSDSYGAVALWRSDGTLAGTVKVKDIELGYLFCIRDQAVLGDSLYFSAHDTGGYELWKSDGTAEGTVKVADIHGAGSSWPHEFTAMDGHVYFAASDSTHGTELWKTDGRTMEPSWWPTSTLQVIPSQRS